MRKDGTYLCNGAYYADPKKTAKYITEVTCKSCLKRIKEQEIGDELF
jgi:hypothetical protein